MKKRITSSDVAREAGVSRATVSYIMNNTEGNRISDETRERVMKAAKKLGYHMDINARALKTQRSMSIAVVSRRNIRESRFVNVLGGIKEVLSKEGYSILLCSDEKDAMGYPEYYRLYQSNKVDGIIFISYQEQLDIEVANKQAELMIEEQIPCVFADYHLGNPRVNSVDINYNHGAYITTKYMIEKGHKKIAFLACEWNTEQERQRMEGVRRAIDEAGDVELMIYIFGNSGNYFSESIIETLQERDKYSALIVAWGSVATQALYYANKLKIPVPEEIAIISLAGDPGARSTFPRLSTCELPLYDLGVRGAHLLIDSMKRLGIPTSMLLPCKINIQESD